MLIARRRSQSTAWQPAPHGQRQEQTASRKLQTRRPHPDPRRWTCDLMHNAGRQHIPVLISLQQIHKCSSLRHRERKQFGTHLQRSRKKFSRMPTKNVTFMRNGSLRTAMKCLSLGSASSRESRLELDNSAKEQPSPNQVTLHLRKQERHCAPVVNVRSEAEKRLDLRPRVVPLHSQQQVLPTVKHVAVSTEALDTRRQLEHEHLQAAASKHFHLPDLPPDAGQ